MRIGQSDALRCKGTSNGETFTDCWKDFLEQRTWEPEKERGLLVTLKAIAED
jgi:hypothetical protein